MRADVGHDLDLEIMHQAVALRVPREAGLRGAGRRIGDELGLFARIQRAKRRELIGGRAGVIEPREIKRIMRRRHLLERGAIDLVHLGMAAVFLAGLDLDRLRDGHAGAQNVADQLEERQIERGLGMQRHCGPKGHGPLGLEILGQRGRIGDFAGVRGLLPCRVARGAARGLRFGGVLRAHEAHMERHLTARHDAITPARARSSAL